MKSLALALALMFGTVGFVHAAETKQVCKDVKGKDGKTKQQCKDVKVHKKLEGTAVPEKKKK